nr:MAG TPA: hypothetical protein [Caudoviricetes sp.]DAT20274.1 MAG TPA: hypothetical protein [Caudoviricetes sp.]
MLMQKSFIETIILILILILVVISMLNPSK